MAKHFRSGFVAIIGRPNVGKSSFLNHVIAEKISIITEKPQTTRDRILGIWNGEEAQIVFLDTPGIHEPHKELNRYMVDKAVTTLHEADLVMVMAEPDDTPSKISLITNHLKKAEKGAILALNMIDLISRDEAQTRLTELGKAYPFRHCLGISSLTGEGIDALMGIIKAALPEGPRFFPEDMFTDLSERFLCREIIREKVFTLTHKEIPYSVAVEIEQFREGFPTYIGAVVHVERESQKAIVIGEKGGMLKQIGTLARLDIQRLLGVKVYLKLFVRVTRDWTKNTQELKRLGYT